jgi:hypothetical protein
MGVIVAAQVVPIYWALKIWPNPDNRFFRSDRKHILRGEAEKLYEEDEQEHPVERA